MQIKKYFYGLRLLVVRTEVLQTDLNTSTDYPRGVSDRQDISPIYSTHQITATYPSWPAVLAWHQHMAVYVGQNYKKTSTFWQRDEGYFSCPPGPLYSIQLSRVNWLVGLVGDPIISGQQRVEARGKNIFLREYSKMKTIGPASRRNKTRACM